MSKYLLTFPGIEGEIEFVYDDGEILQSVTFSGNFPIDMRGAILRMAPTTPERLQSINWKTGVVTPIEAMVTFEMFWDRYNDKARSSKVKTERVWNKMPEGERTKAYRYINRYKSSIPQGVCMKYATTYLNDQMWNN